MSRVTILLIFQLIWTFNYAQEILKVHASGSSMIVGDVSPEKAFKKAILEAQIDAIRKAGIGEDVSVSTTLFTSDDGSSFNQQFNEWSTVEINANVLIDSIYKKENRFDQFGNIIVQVEIYASVYKYSKNRDPAFFFKIEGLKDTYYENESISFSLTPSQDGFLKVFAINDKESYMLYPFTNPESNYLSDERDRLFQKGETVRFPIHPAYQPGYSAELPSGVEAEDNDLIFVFLKNDIPFIERKINRRNIEKWIYQIPIDRRSVQFRRIRLYGL